MKRYGSIIGLRPDKIEEYRSPLFQSQPMKRHVTALTALPGPPSAENPI